MRHFLNLRKRLKIRHLVVLGACAVGSSQAATLGGFDRIMTTAYDPGSYEAVIQAMAKTGEREQIEALRIRGLNPSFAQKLWNLPASEILTLNFSTARQPIASDAVARSFGISTQDRSAHFRQMLTALRAQWAKQGKHFALSDNEIEKLVQLLANGQADGDMSVDPKLLAAVQASAEQFSQATTNEARQDSIESFTDSLGSLASQVGGEAGALLGSAHGALNDTLASSDSGTMDFGGLELGNGGESNPFSALDSGKLFADMNLKDTGFLYEGGPGNSDSLPDNSWLKPGDVDRLLQRQADSGSSSARNFAAYRPSSPSSSAGASETSAKLEGTSAAGSTASAHDGDAAARQRLQAITDEVRRGRSASHGSASSDKQIGNGSDPFNSGDNSIGSPSGTANAQTSSPSGKTPQTPVETAPAADTPASETLKAMGRVEAENLGITDSAKVDEFVNKYVEQNTIREEPAPWTGTSNGSTGTQVASNQATGVPARHAAPGANPNVSAGQTDDRVPANDSSAGTCPVAESQQKMQQLTMNFIQLYRLGIVTEESKEALAECDTICSRDIKPANSSNSAAALDESPEQWLSYKQTEKQGRLSSTAEIVTGLLNPRIRKIMAERNFCPSSHELTALASKDEIKQFGDIYTQALYEELGAQKIIALDSKSCPAIQSLDPSQNSDALDKFTKFTTHIAEQERKISVDLQGQDPATYCSHGDLTEAPFDMKPVVGTYLAHLANRCKVAAQEATNLMFRGWKLAQFKDKRASSDATKQNCLQRKTAYLAMKQLGFSHAVNTAPTPVVIPNEPTSDKVVHE